MSPLRVVELPIPFAHQREVLLDDHPIKVPCIGRQGGKTLLGGIAALDGHGPLVEGTPMYRGALHGAAVLWATKDYPTSEKIWRDLKAYLAKWGIDLQKNETTKRMEFPGGGSITLRTASDPDTMRGDTYDALIGDEVAFWHPESLSTVRPALAVRRAWQILISTPFGFNWYWDEFRRGDERLDPKYRSWRWPSTINPTFPPEELEAARARENPDFFAREFLAEFRVSEGSIFRRDWFKGFTEDEAWIYPEIGEKVAKSSLQTFMTADFALTKKTYSDHTAIAVVSVAPDKRIFMRDLLRVKVTRAELVPLVKRIQERWEALFVYCESSGELANLNQELVRAGIRIRERKIHQKFEGKKGEDKVSRAFEASKAVELARIFFLHTKQPNGSTAPARWVGDLVAEACGFTGEAGRPDDMVDALSLSVLGVPFLVFREAKTAPNYEPKKDEKEGGGRWLIGR